jgi:hypothetical protein
MKHLMGIEHRWTGRQAIDHSVLIKTHGQGSRQARARDISSSGMFVELPPTAAPLSKNKKVELIFVRSTKRISRILRIPALVVRTTRSGAGLMFFDSSPAAFHTLLAHLLAETKQVPQRSRTTQLANAMLQLTHTTDAGVGDLSGERLKVLDERITQGERHE